ncbi:MAG: YdeI/OmpD-associated family protein [Steroidobacteraceae bacterium]
MKNPALDAYIAKSPEFARPILVHLRLLMHEACPQIEETMKWSVPHFEHKGIVANMAAFKHHAAFGFWSQKLLKEKLPKGADALFPKAGESSMGGRKIQALSDLPSDAVLIRFIEAAVALNEEAIRPTRDLKKKPPVKPPPYLLAALRKNAKARKTFEGFTPSQQRKYVDWLTEAKQDATRDKRLASTIEWLAEGKQRNWKHQNC